MSAVVNYSRQNPSPEYIRLSALYKEHHKKADNDNWAKDVYPGVSLWPHIGFIKSAIERHGAKTLLDYGAGKGMQYTNMRVKVAKGRMYPSVTAYWGVKETCYDAGYEPFNKFPEGTFDAVISTDVLEHCAQDDMVWIITEMFEKADKFVFANIACYPAKTILPNGENAHATIQPPEWWKALIEGVARNYPDKAYYFLATTKKNQDATLISNQKPFDDVPSVGALPGNFFKACIQLVKQRIGLH